MPRRIRPTTVHPPALRALEVLRIEDVTPAMRRITFTGEQLGAFTPTPGLEIPPFASSGFDDDVNLIFPYPGESAPVLPSYADGRIVPARDPRPLGRHYTVRRYDPVARELDIDFVAHGVGIAATWAYRAAVGDALHLGGPSASLGLPEGFERMIVAGDEAALPAIARLLEELPVDAVAEVVIEVADAAHRQELRALPGVRVAWTIGAGTLVEAVRALPQQDGRVYAWVAGEQSAVRDLRRHLVEDRGIPKDDIEFCGYWKRAAVATLASDPALPEEGDDHADEERFEEQASLLRPYAIRAAVGLGLGDLIGRGVVTAEQLAERSGADPGALAKLLRYLETIELLERDGERWGLTATGVHLAEEWFIEHLDPRGVDAALEQAFRGLEQSVRSGGPSLAAVTGRDYAGLRADEALEPVFLDGLAEGADYVAAPLVAAPAFPREGTAVLHADIAGAIAAAAVEAHPQLTLTIAAEPAQARWLAEDLIRSIPDAAARSRVRIADPAAAAASRPDTVLLIDQLRRHPDAQAAELLRATAAGLAEGGRLVLLETAMDREDVEEFDADLDLLYLTVHGTGYRSNPEVDALVAAAGLRVLADEPFGWGDRLRVLAL